MNNRTKLQQNQNRANQPTQNRKRPANYTLAKLIPKPKFLQKEYTI